MYYNHNIKKKGISDNYLPNYHTRLDMKYPWVVKWNISDKCNLECRHCFRSNALSIISKEDADTIINDMGENGVACVALTGGEPLMNPNLMYIIQRLKEKNIDVEIATNGTLINKKIAKKIYNSGVKKIQISLDGADETSNDMIRGRGAYNNIINGIQILIKSGFFVTIATTLNAKTVHQIDQFIMLKNMLSVSAIRFEIYIPIRKPLMNPNLMYIIQRLKEKNIDVEIATNGTLINKKIAKKIYNSGVKKIQISLDGADETSNDMIRGRGAYNNIINGIQILIKSGFFVTIATTLNAKTVHQIDQFIMLKNMLSVSAIRFEIYIPIRKLPVYYK